MSDRNNITLLRETVVQAVKALSPMAYDTWPRERNEVVEALRAALAAPEPTHPGYIIGSHWLETAYSRVCAGEAEADVLKDCGWRRDAERDEAVKAEREACAKVCEALANDPEVDEMAYRALREADEAIRARGEVPR